MNTEILLFAENSVGYEILKNIVKMFEGFDYVWFPNKFDDEKHTISLMDIPASQLEVAEWAEAIENILVYMGKLDTDTPHKYRSLRYSMLCSSLNYDDGNEGISYEIERCDGKVTIKETPVYIKIDTFEFDNCDELREEYGLDFDEEFVEHFENSTEVFIVNDAAYFDEEPDYGPAIALSEFIKQKR